MTFLLHDGNIVFQSILVSFLNASGAYLEREAGLNRKSVGMVILGDFLEVARNKKADYFDSVITDPPYGIKFMGKEWDHGIPGVPFWVEALRVAKPGAFLCAFGGTRTHHRLMVAIEDAGWEIRDMIMWVYGSGFPKSLDVSKAIDKAAGVKRKVVGERPYTCQDIRGNSSNGNGISGPRILGRERLSISFTEAITDAAKQWEGWGTALKPAWEPIICARKPLAGTVAANILKYGTGGINIDGCRVELNGDYKCKANGRPSQTGLPDNYNPLNANKADNIGRCIGRWPANLIHDGSDEVLALFPNTKSGKDINPAKTSSSGFTGNGIRTEDVNYGDNGSAARFFYCAKASQSERGKDNNHPTVKHLVLMTYLCKLVTPPNGIILDPFCGSGSTGVAAVKLGFKFIGIDKEKSSVDIAKNRMKEII